MVDKKKILISDDDKEAALFLQKGLQREGFDVCLAFDGEEAKAAIKENKPDLVLLDLMMPKINGWQVLEWLRQEEKSPIPVIVVSAKDELSDLKKCYGLKADTYLVKPIDVTNVLTAIHAVFSIGID
jgi:DNA-binding response OmpR family regulator